MKIKAIIFDYYDTLMFSGLKTFLIKNGIDFNGPEIVAAHDRLDSGKDASDDFYKRLSKFINVPAEKIRTVNAKTPNKQLLGFIKEELFGKYQLAIISNVHKETAITERLTPDELAMFEYIGMSFATGFIKPDEKAYIDAADHLGVDPTECVFVDDRPQYCASAEQVGMKSILYKDIDDLKTKLGQILSSQNMD